VKANNGLRSKDYCMIPGRRNRQTVERFWRHADRSGDCWLWTGCLGTGGYGRFTIGPGSQVYAHRFAWAVVFGVPPDSSLTVDHLCNIRACVNPIHLALVPIRDNVLRGESFAAKNAAKTRCSRGHPFDDMNTRIAPSGQRVCRRCSRRHSSDYRARKAGVL